MDRRGEADRLERRGARLVHARVRVERVGHRLADAAELVSRVVLRGDDDHDGGDDAEGGDEGEGDAGFHARRGITGLGRRGAMQCGGTPALSRTQDRSSVRPR